MRKINKKLHINGKKQAKHTNQCISVESFIRYEEISNNAGRTISLERNYYLSKEGKMGSRDQEELTILQLCKIEILEKRKMRSFKTESNG